MATFYIGYRNVLKGRNDPINTYTGKIGVYSNWDLMNPDHVLDGAPDRNVQPGTGDYPYGLQLSRWFLGLDPAGLPTANSGILHPDIYSGRFPIYLFQGITSIWNQSPLEQGANGYGHIFAWGGTSADTAGTGVGAPYASLGYFYYGLITEKSGALKNDATLGHVERYPGTDPTAPSTFGAFEPYLYKGVITEKSDPLSSTYAALGHIEYAATGAGILGADEYGFEHVLEWNGVPSAKAL